MKRTDNFNLAIPEGSDTVNFLVQTFPNFEVIDEQLKKDLDMGVNKATHIKSGTTHGLVRENGDAPFMYFLATSDFKSGDTFTVDGVIVAAILPTGASLGDDAFRTNSVVLCSLVGTTLTVYTDSASLTVAEDSEKLGGQLPSYYAKESDLAQTQTLAEATARIAGDNADNIETIEAFLNPTEGTTLYTGVRNDTTSFNVNLTDVLKYQYIVVNVDVANCGSGAYIIPTACIKAGVLPYYRITVVNPTLLDYSYSIAFTVTNEKFILAVFSGGTQARSALNAKTYTIYGV